jgi:hypothetical protein
MTVGWSVLMATGEGKLFVFGVIQAVNAITRVNSILIAAMRLFCIFPPVLCGHYYML